MPSESRSTLRILLVDDHPELLEISAVILGIEGHSCETASSGREALAALGDGAFDLAILDLGLPDINGFEVARLIRSRTPEILLCALSGWRLTEDQAQQLTMFDRFVEKPVTPTMLRALVQDLERLRRTAG
ncbi:MAG: putative histidine kinase, hybrid [Myxococcales bacterium]|nr:putative histidine kinase, hybrid [Myxococcales bacterium]